MKPKLLIAILLFSCASAYSQDDYMIVKTLPLNDSITFTSLRYGRRDYGYGIVNSKGVMMWQIPSPGFPVGMGKFNKNAVVFYSQDNTEGARSVKEIHAAVVDVSTRKITTDKVVYTNETNYQVDQLVLDDPSGGFFCILLRTSPLKKGFASYANNADAKFTETTQLTALFINADLTPQTKDLKSISVGSAFISACTGSNSDLYVCSYSNDQVTVEKFDDNGNAVSKLSAEASIRDKSKFYPLMKCDAMETNTADMVVAYKNNHKDDAMRTYRFDFNNQKAYASQETVLDKSYIRTLEKPENTSLSNFKSIDDLYPVQLMETDDQLIIFKEIQYQYTPAGDDAKQFYRTGALISLYAKKDLHLQMDITIDKTFGSFIMAANDIAGYVKNGKLYTATCELIGSGKYKTFLYTINLKDGTTEKKALEREGRGKEWVTDPAAIVWFSNNYIIPFHEASAFIHMKFETDLQPEKY